MKHSDLFSSCVIVLGVVLTFIACVPPHHGMGYGPTTNQTVVANTGSGVQYLYVPATNIATTSIQQVVVESQDGRTFTLGPSDIQGVASGRLALGIPPGVTQGQVIIISNGVTQPAIPFYIAQPVTTLVTTTVVSPQCYDISGSWTGNISESDPNAVATAQLQLGADCQSVSGFIHWEGPRIGSIDSTITGVWDASSMTLIARDAQLFNVRPAPGSGFCATDQYRLNLSPDGHTFTGLNIVTERSCAGQSRVYLRR